MEVTLNVHMHDGQIIADSPETGYHEEVANVVLIDQSKNTILGIGTTLEEAQQIAPEAYTAIKNVLMVLPVFSNMDFQPTVTYAGLLYFIAAACLYKRNHFLLSIFRRMSINCHLWLTGYEQIPQTMRECFEYDMLVSALQRGWRIKQLVINDREITKLSQDLIDEGKRFHRTQVLTNSLIDLFNLICIGFFLGLFALITYVLTPSTILLAVDNARMDYHLVATVGLIVLIVTLMIIAFYLGEIIGTLSSLALLRCFLPSEDVTVIIKNRQFQSKLLKNMVSKLFAL